MGFATICNKAMGGLCYFTIACNFFQMIGAHFNYHHFCILFNF